jgi:glycosyltransferase involved in cell wall biosynthesis
LLAKAYYSLADRLLVYSTKERVYLEELGVDRRRIRICYNGLDLEGLQERRESILESARQLRSGAVPEGARLILYVGGLIPDKRVDDLLYAFSSLDQSCTPVHLWVVGAGHARVSLEVLSHDLRIDNVRFLGRIVDDIESYFAAADFFVLPGLGGLALNQAMFWGTPCVASEADGTEDDLVINGRTGFRFELGNRESLLTALNACVGLPDPERERMGRAARALILSQSNVNAMVAEFNRSIAELLPIDSADVSRSQLKCG